MGIRNKKQETLRRLDSKTLDARFLNEIRNGLNCSPFPVRYDHCVPSLIFLHLHAFLSLGLMHRLLASEDALSLWRREAENTAVFEGYEDPCLMIHGCARLDHGSRKLLAPEL